MRALLQGSNTEGPLKWQLWAEAVLTASELDQILVKYGEPKNSFQNCFGSKRSWYRSSVVVGFPLRDWKFLVQNLGMVEILCNIFFGQFKAYPFVLSGTRPFLSVTQCYVLNLWCYYKGGKYSTVIIRLADSRFLLKNWPKTFDRCRQEIE